MRQRARLYLLLGLLVVLAGSYYFANRRQVPGMPGVMAADTKVQPLEVQGPQLHLDLLEQIKKPEPPGTLRNIFLAAPPPPPKAPTVKAPPPFVGPRQPPPPPPLQVPATFFGYAWRPKSGKRVAFFSSGDDVLVVPEGDTFLNGLRLIHIGNDSADVEEVSTGRHATVPMVQPEGGATP